MKRRTYGTGSVYQRGRIWYIKYHHHGEPQRECAHSERKDDALRLLRKRLGEISQGKYQGLAVERVTIGDIVRLVLTDYETRGLRSKRDVEIRWEHALEPKLGTALAARLDSKQIQEYIGARLEEVSPATVNRELAILRRAYTLALKHEPPLALRAPPIPKLPEENTREGFVSAEQYGRLLNAVPNHLRTLLVIGYHTGMRAGEIRKLRWEQVDSAAGHIRLSAKQTKGKRARTAPIYGEMRAELERAKRERDEYWPACDLICHRAGELIRAALPGWKEAVKEAGLPGLLFHDLRRSAVRNMNRAGISRHVAMRISGHKTESVFRRYDIVDEQDIADAGRKMEDFLGERQQRKLRKTGTK
jgi:integrase